LSAKPRPPRPEPPGAGAGEPLALRVERLSRENTELFARLVADERRFRGLARSVWRVEEAERRRLARELHDGLGQTLTALKIQLARLAERAGDPGDDLGAALRGAAELAAGALADTRRLSHLLRPRVLDDLGLVAALKWLARTLGESAGFAVRFAHSGMAGGVAPDLETLIFRVAQEALTNAIKHSGAPGAEVELRRRGPRVRLVVRDEGRGFDAANPPPAGAEGSGLAAMRDRVELSGGRLAIDSAPGRGTAVTVELNLAEVA
jgi:two-component system sensor histidine kinase UhpB